MRSLKRPSQRLNADYSGVDVAEGVDDANGTANTDFVSGSGSETASFGTVCGDDVGDAWDDVAGRDLEIWMSDSRAIRATITAPIPATAAILAQQSASFPIPSDSVCCSRLCLAIRFDSTSFLREF